LTNQSATLTIPKRHFDRTKARFTSALKKDSSSLANSETQAPSKCVSKRLAVGTVYHFYLRLEGQPAQLSQKEDCLRRVTVPETYDASEPIEKKGI
jgi:hypothetical protein